MVHTILSQLRQNQTKTNKTSETTICLQESGFVAKQQQPDLEQKKKNQKH